MVTPDHDAPAPGESSGGEPPRLLIVDNERGNRQTLADIFEECGFAVETAATGEEALAKGQEQSFHAAVLEVELPDMSGIAVLDLLRERQPDMAAVIATAYGSLQTSVRAIQSDVDAYVLKPLDIAHLQSVVDQALDRRRSSADSGRLLAQARERILALEQRETELIDRIERLEQENAALRRPQ